MASETPAVFILVEDSKQLHALHQELTASQQLWDVVMGLQPSSPSRRGEDPRPPCLGLAASAVGSLYLRVHVRRQTLATVLQP
ncbi:uncharacterized protein LOC144615880 isoform X2 [Panthera onca]